MRIVFLVAFIGGLILVVFSMLHGVEHLRRSRKSAPSPFFNLPNVAAFATGFGATGYPLANRTSLPVWGVIVLSLLGGVIAISGMIVLLAQWALRGAGTIPEHEADEIQGTFARVTENISSLGRGRIVFERYGKVVEADAESLTKSSMPVGTEVVIDRIENGIAFVEEWSVVEQRL